MKFGKELQIRAVPLWREKYISYKRLKRIIKKLQPKPSLSNSTQAIPPKYYLSLNSGEKNGEKVSLLMEEMKKEFEDALEEDVERVNSFYCEKEGELSKCLAELEDKAV